MGSLNLPFGDHDASCCGHRETARGVAWCFSRLRVIDTFNRDLHSSCSIGLGLER